VIIKMAVPKRSELANRQGRRKKQEEIKCETQFPECPEERDPEHVECKKCPFNGEKKKIPAWLLR
jgi:ribosomal protein L32